MSNKHCVEQPQLHRIYIRVHERHMSYITMKLVSFFFRHMYKYWLELKFYERQIAKTKLLLKIILASSLTLFAFFAEWLNLAFPLLREPLTIFRNNCIIQWRRGGEGMGFGRGGGDGGVVECITIMCKKNSAYG